MKKALIIFVRNPEPGKVKTRLAAQIGNEKALAVYIKLLQHTKQVASGADCDKYIFATAPLKDDTWKDFHVESQIEAGLGERMLHAFNLLFKKDYKKVVIIGSDCPELTTTHIEEAFANLEQYDVVIGPAKDGGYYLLGMKTLHTKLFEDKPWSTASVLKDTLHTIDGLNLSCHLLETLTDVDEEKDLPQNWI